MQAQAKLAISACLNGEKVRYDGANRRFALGKKLAEYFDFQAYCPEMAIGLGVPRQTLRLVGELGEEALVQPATGSDVSAEMKAYAAEVAENILADDAMCGYVLCKGSPSCGLERVKRYTEGGNVSGHDATGIFVAELQKLIPWLPLEEDGRLNDGPLLENFLTRVYIVQRWRVLRAGGITLHKLMDFHARHKFMTLAHSTEQYRALGRFVAESGKDDIEQRADDYFDLLMRVLTTPASVARHTNVLMHLQGFLKQSLSSTERQELRDVIMAYRKRELPRQAVLTLLRHHLLMHPNHYAASQYYLEPFPRAFALH